MIHDRLLSVVAAAALAAPGAAQLNDFLLPLGVPQNAGDDTITPAVPLGFSFTLPDGMVVSSIDIDSNGRILAPAADQSDYSDSVMELLSEAHASICPLWCDNTLDAPADDIYFNTDNVGSAWITWKDARQFGGTSLYTFQVQLHAATPNSQQRIVFVYDARVPPIGCVVGLSEGNGAMDPGGSDLSSSTTVPIVTAGVTTIYEAPTAFDLQSTAIEFSPDGIGGWVVVGNPIATPPVARNEVIGNCIESLTFVPDGMGNYNITRVPASAGLLNPAFGSTFGLAGDDAMSGPVDLGFPFPFPGGSSSQLVNVDSNGRIVPDGSGAMSDYSPTVLELLTNAYPSVGTWVDFNPSGGGAVKFNASFAGYAAGTVATFTWDGVPFFGSSDGHSVQIQLFADGSVTMVFVATQLLDSGTFSWQDILVGLSPGNGTPDPGELDLSTANGGPSRGATAYEYFDNSIPEPWDLQSGVVLVADSVPVPGTVWTLRGVKVPASATIAKLIIGFGPPLNFDLGVLGIGFTPGCNLIPNPTVVLDGTIAAGGIGETDPFNLNLPSSSSLGLEAYLQIATDGGFAPGFPTEFSTGIKGTIGL